MFKKYIEYIKYNPKGYWFKAKLYGWGWTPVKWQGLVVILFYVTAVFLLTPAVKENSTGHDVIFDFILPVSFLTAMLIGVCYLTGEKPHWSWGESNDKKKK